MRPIASHPLSDPYARRAVVVDHEPLRAGAMVTSLRNQGFTVHQAADGFAGIEAVRRHSPDLTVIDTDIPGIDGFETVRRLRRDFDGFVMLVSDDDSESAVVEGFRSGADEYVLKPYGNHALRARIDALLRRSRQLATAVAAESDEEAWIDHGSLRLHPRSRRVEVHGIDCELTRSEFDLLLTLLRAKDQVFSKSSLALILREANGMPSQHITAHDRHAVEVHVMNLRRKLGDDPRDPQCVETVRGLGYRLAPAALRQPVPLHAAAV